VGQFVRIDGTIWREVYAVRFVFVPGGGTVVDDGNGGELPGRLRKGTATVGPSTASEASKPRLSKGTPVPRFSVAVRVLSPRPQGATNGSE
jgi:hypothetical protein